MRRRVGLRGSLVPQTRAHERAVELALIRVADPSAVESGDDAPQPFQHAGEYARSTGGRAPDSRGGAGPSASGTELSDPIHGKRDCAGRAAGCLGGFRNRGAGRGHDGPLNGTSDQVHRRVHRLSLLRGRESVADARWDT